MQYKIGDVSRILGISRDLLRYYEKKGVVAPTKDKNNDYRYYDTWDINYLIDCVWYKSFGFGIEEIAHMLSECDTEALVEKLDEKSDALRASIRHQQLLLQRIRRHREGVSQIHDYLGQCEIAKSPPMACYLNRYTYTYESTDEVQRLTHQWMDYMPFSKRYFEITREDLLGECDDYAWGFSLDMEYVEAFGVTIEPPAVFVPSQLSIHSAFKSVGKNAFTPRLLDYAREYAEANHLKICGNAHGNLVCSVLEEGQITGFFEVWLPIEES